MLPQWDLMASWQTRSSPPPKAALTPSSWPRDLSGGIRAAAGKLWWHHDGQKGWRCAHCWAAGNWQPLGKAAGRCLDALRDPKFGQSGKRPSGGNTVGKLIGKWQSGIKMGQPGKEQMLISSPLQSLASLVLLCPGDSCCASVSSHCRSCVVAKDKATNQNRFSVAGQKECLCWLHYLMAPPVLQGWRLKGQLEIVGGIPGASPA